jgi:hypothetical protein
MVALDTGKVFRGVGKRGDGYDSHPAAFSPDGKVLLGQSDLAGYGSRSPRYWVRLRDASTGRILRELDWSKDEWLLQANFSPDGTRLALVSRRSFRTGRVSLWDVATGKHVPFGPGKDLEGGHAAFTADNRVLATIADNAGRAELRVEPGPPDRRLSLWELASGQRSLEVNCPAVPVCCHSSPDGRLLAWGDGDGGVGLLDLLTGRVLRRFQGHRGAVRSLAFIHDGRVLVSGSEDTTALLWDVSACRPRREKSPARRELGRLWERLAESDARQARQAMVALCASPGLSVPFLADRLKPVSPPDSARMRRLLADLDNDRFEVRQKAVAELEGLGELAVSHLRKLLQRRVTLEARMRAERLLRRWAGSVLPPARLREVRAVAVLEFSDTPEARRLLGVLAKGAAEARLTQEAKAALRRLARKPGPVP